MADPFSIFASAATLASEGLKLSKTIYTFVKEVRGSDDEASRFVDEIKVTSACLHQFGNNLHTMTEQETRYFHPDFFEKTKECVASCQEIFGQLRTSISDAVPGIIFQTGDPVEFIMRKRDQLSWPFTRIQIVSTSKQLRKSKADLHLLVDLMMFTCNQQREKDERQRRIRHDTVRAKQKRIESKILETKFMNLKLERDLAECALDDPIDFYEETKPRSAYTATNNDFAHSNQAFDSKDWGAWGAERKHHSPANKDFTHPDQALDDRDWRFSGAGENHRFEGLDPSDQAQPPLDKEDDNPTHAQNEQTDVPMMNGIGTSGPQPMNQKDLEADTSLNESLKASHQAAAAEDHINPSKSTQTPELGLDESNATKNASAGVKKGDHPHNASVTKGGDAKKSQGERKTRRLETRFWKRLKSPERAAKNSTEIGYEASIADPRTMYDARIWRASSHWKEFSSPKDEPLPYSREEIMEIVQKFQNKRKSVAERYDRLGEELRKSVKRHLDDINHMLVEQWSIAAILIAPKRARFTDIDTATIVFWWRPTDPALPRAMRGAGRDETVRLPQFLRLRDAVSRLFIVPWEVASTWKGIRQVVEQAFLHVELLGDHVLAGHYDLLDPVGAIILPNLWEKVVRPGWTVSMQLWPVPETEAKKEDPKKNETKSASKSKPRKEKPQSAPLFDQPDTRNASRTQQDMPFDIPPPPPQPAGPTDVPPPPGMPYMPPPPPGVPIHSYQQSGSRLYPVYPENEDWGVVKKRRPGRKRVSPRAAGASILQWAAGGGTKRRQSPPRVTELSDTESSVEYGHQPRDDGSHPIALATTSVRRNENWADMQRDKNQANWQRLVRKEGDSLMRLLDRSTESPHDLRQLQEEHKKLQSMMYGQPDPLRDLMRQYTVLDIDGEKQDEDGQEDQPRRHGAATILESPEEGAEEDVAVDGVMSDNDYPD